MPGETVNSAKNILSNIESLKNATSQIDLLKKNKTLNQEQKNQLNDLNSKRKEILNKIDQELGLIYKIVNPQQQTSTIKKPTSHTLLPKPQIILPNKREIPKIAIEQHSEVNTTFASDKFKKLTKQEKKIYLKELNIKDSEIKKFVKYQKDKQQGKTKKLLVKEDYTIYKPSKFGEIANKYMKKYADNVVKKYPKFFELMFTHFKMVEMELLSRTYVSIMLFCTLLAFPGIFLFFLALNFAFHLSILKILLIAFIGTILTFVGFYFYPASLIGGKTSKIKLELPFALVHMSAVAGSGANPMSIFQLIADSEEYPELKKEIKKILNYVNLFGYNLTNALKNVAKNTPNPDLKELLNGMISTIETGGDLKGYLKEKADDALNTYKLDRKKQVEALATYSEIYTALLIASPLLLLVTLAIINSIGGNLGGLSVSTIAWISIIGVLPVLNISFMVFINISQKGMN